MYFEESRPQLLLLWLLVLLVNINKTTAYTMEEIKMPHKPQTNLFLILRDNPVIL